MADDKRRADTARNHVRILPDILHPDWNTNFFWRLLNAANAGVLVINRAFEIVYCNEYVAEILVGVPAEQLTGRSLAGFRTLPDEEMAAVAAHMNEVFEHGRAADVENWAIRSDGTRRRVFWSSTPLFDAAGAVSHLVSIGWDVTRQRDLETRLKSLAHFDGLTGLYNRASFMELLRTTLLERPGRCRLALLFIDLDGFKAINDGHGHDAGDEALREVAARLRRALRQDDIVARLGGDEFVVLLPDVGRSDAASAAGKLLEALAIPHDHGSARLALGASIGIALSPDDGEVVDDLLQRADAAMYRAKAAGKNRFRFGDGGDSAIVYRNE